MPDREPDILGIIETLVLELGARGIRYCHWKSNEHLDASFRGDTDLDVLFDEDDRAGALEALAAAGFVQCRAVWFRRYHWIEDYIGIDDRTGKVVHVHAHWRLVLGESGIKSFRLPWERALLGGATPVGSIGFPAARPAHEILLLIVRVALKQQFRARGDAAGQRRRAYLADEQREFAWLRARTDRAELAALAGDMLGEGAIASVMSVYDSGLTEEGAAGVYAGARVFLLCCRTMGRTRAAVFRCARRTAYRVVAGLNRRGWTRQLAQKRVCIGPGLVIAVVGADGSGKSTLVEAVSRELQKKFDVVRLYMGARPDSASRLRRLIRGRGGALGRALSNVVMAVEKRSRRRYADRCRRRGMMVVMDRYPQASCPLKNDGPRLSHLHGHTLWPMRALGRWEARQYDDAGCPAPDLLVRLSTSPAVLSARRPEVPESELAEKQAALMKAEFRGSGRVIEVDAGKTREEVFIEVMRSISARMRRDAAAEAGGEVAPVSGTPAGAVGA